MSDRCDHGTSLDLSCADCIAEEKEELEGGYCEECAHFKREFELCEAELSQKHGECSVLESENARLSEVLEKADKLAASVWKHYIDGSGTECTDCVVFAKVYRKARKAVAAGGEKDGS